LRNKKDLNLTLKEKIMKKIVGGADRHRSALESGGKDQRRR
jgi:hypothetical protein